MYGDNNDENTRVDVIIGTAEDFLKSAIAIHYEKDETKKAELKKDLEENKLPQFFSLLEDILKENNDGDGFFVGKKVEAWFNLYLFHSSFQTLKISLDM